MKVAGAIFIALMAVGALIVVFLIGLGIGLRRSWNARLHKLGLNSRSAVLHARAIKILMRLDQLTDLDGLIAGDRLSPETKDMVAKWATDYRLGVSK